MLESEKNLLVGEGSVSIGAGNDTTIYKPKLRRIYVGTTGNVKVSVPVPNAANADVTYSNVPAGTYITCRAIIVYATGTTASNLIGEY